MAKQPPAMLLRVQDWAPNADDFELIDVFAEIYVEFQNRGMSLKPFMADPEPVLKLKKRRFQWLSSV